MQNVDYKTITVYIGTMENKDINENLTKAGEEDFTTHNVEGNSNKKKFPKFTFDT